MPFRLLLYVVDWGRSLLSPPTRAAPDATTNINAQEVRENIIQPPPAHNHEARVAGAIFMGTLSQYPPPYRSRDTLPLYTPRRILTTNSERRTNFSGFVNHLRE
ncbi:hypothetical protein GALMADRAFT_227697 [Galerina marginata CBS 339.88]|uniref:Uncharacterized protein n=1 Tax=Galerina marginata (strain CBS 339.88) TaxID=685588 RepID=A0A067SSY4_GALM3|nr:hypothetical protein GALMADRAFT_227697 [Galerina marginata CBS 339.88]